MSHSKTLTGTLRKADLGAGAWVLDADDGHQWQLAGPVPDALDGRRVRVTGRDAGLFSFAMAGRSLQVESIRGV